MRDICIAISIIRNSTAAGFYDKCSAVRALRVYLRPRFSLHRTENDNITLRPLKCRYRSDMEFSVKRRCSTLPSPRTSRTEKQPCNLHPEFNGSPGINSILTPRPDKKWFIKDRGLF